jgi:hypothetical protein
MEWQKLKGNWVLVPERPAAIIHFLGGAFVAAAPHVTYRSLLEWLASQGYVVVATPFEMIFDHQKIADQVMRNFNLAVDHLLNEVLGRGYLPIYGMGHSMGCKLHLLITSQHQQERAGNILIAFNNYPAKRSIPGLEQISSFASQMSAQLTAQLAQPLQTPVKLDLDVEFTPSPEETFRLIADQYPVPRTLLLKFRNDEIDQTRALWDVLQSRFPETTAVEILPGNHLTPLGQDINWKAGKEFNPVDAIAQFVKEQVSKDANQLRRTVYRWLNPLDVFSGGQ